MSASEQPTKKTSFWRALLKYGVPLLVTIGLCYLLFTGVNFSEMIAIIRRDCNFWWIALALVISIFSHIFRAMRWSIQLDALGVKTPLFILVLSIFGTYAVNLVLPRLGELWRTGYIAQRQRASFTTVFGSMVADRLADTVTVALLTAFTFLIASKELLSYLSQNPEAYQSVIGLLTSPWLWAAVVVCLGVVVFVFKMYPDNKLVKATIGFIKGLWEGFAVVAHMKGKGRWLLLTVCIWGCYFLQLYVAFFSFPVTAEVVSRYGVVAVLVCFVLSSISMGVPSNGGIGPWQWAIIFGLSMFATGIPGLTKEYSTSFANLVMGCQTLLLILLGLFTFICVALDKRRQQKSLPQP
ncbi:MAG: flippase-like domain-containing protein [Bacteroidales bacterium]|nr:flippase-like domain-containing protein [Bacteroidales bacterium]